MTLTITLKSIAEGQLPNTKTTLYTCPADTQATVKSFKFVNTDVAERTMNFYLKRSGSTSRKVTPQDLKLQAGSAFMSEDGDELFLEAADVLEGEADTAATIDYLISILEGPIP